MSFDQSRSGENVKQSEHTTDAFPVLWITGLAGAGKTTIAERVAESLKIRFPNTVLVDGDGVREICGNDLGYDEPDRLKNAYRLSRLAKFLNDQGQIVVCSTMSLYPEIWAWNRAHLRSYTEIFVEVSEEILHERDKKGLYSTDATSVVGKDLHFHRPKADLVLQNDLPGQLETNVARIVQLVQR